MNYKPPRFIAMVITSLQLTQMIVGCTINLWAHDYLKTANRSTCHISPINIKLSIAMYFSYFVLFARFFYITYLSANARKGKSKQYTNGVQPESTSKLCRANDITSRNAMAVTNNKSDKFKKQ